MLICRCLKRDAKNGSCQNSQLLQKLFKTTDRELRSVNLSDESNLKVINRKNLVIARILLNEKNDQFIVPRLQGHLSSFVIQGYITVQFFTNCMMDELTIMCI